MLQEFNPSPHAPPNGDESTPGMNNRGVPLVTGIYPVFLARLQNIVPGHI